MLASLIYISLYLLISHYISLYLYTLELYVYIYIWNMEFVSLYRRYKLQLS